MRKGTALADRKETDFATMAERISVAIESYRHGRRSMDYELKELRSREICIKPVFNELLEEIGKCLWDSMYDFSKVEDRDGELLELLRKWRRHPGQKKGVVVPFDGKVQ